MTTDTPDVFTNFPMKSSHIQFPLIYLKITKITDTTLQTKSDKLEVFKNICMKVKFKKLSRVQFYDVTWQRL